MVTESHSTDNILEINDLKTSFFNEDLEVKDVDDVTFSIPKGKAVGLVGESGSCKSSTSLFIHQLVDSTGKIIGGQIKYKEENLLEKSEAEMRKIRGKEISMIFQEPMTSLNPTYTVGQQIGESFMIHDNLNKKQAYKRSLDMLKLVGIPSPEDRKSVV